MRFPTEACGSKPVDFDSSRATFRIFAIGGQQLQFTFFDREFPAGYLVWCGGNVLLEQMSARLHEQSSFERAVKIILDDSISLHGAELGNVQLLAGDCLVIVLQRGFKGPFLEFFREVRIDDGTACGRALRTSHPVLVSDIETDEEYARAAGYKSVITVPLVTSSGSFLGAVSNHFVNIHKPTSIEMNTLKSYSKIAADHLYQLLAARRSRIKRLR